MMELKIKNGLQGIVHIFVKKVGLISDQFSEDSRKLFELIQLLGIVKRSILNVEVLWKKNYVIVHCPVYYPKLSVYLAVSLNIEFMLIPNSIHRKKKGAVYEYFVIDCEGKIESPILGYEVIYALSKDFYQGIYSETLGGDVIRAKALIDNKGNEIFMGIKEIMKCLPDKEEFILTLEPRCEANKQYYKDSFDTSQPLWCLINSQGKFLFPPQKEPIDFFEDFDLYLIDLK